VYLNRYYASPYYKLAIAIESSQMEGSYFISVRSYNLSRINTDRHIQKIVTVILTCRYNKAISPNALELNELFRPQGWRDFCSCVPSPLTAKIVIARGRESWA